MSINESYIKPTTGDTPPAPLPGFFEGLRISEATKAFTESLTDDQVTDILNTQLVKLRKRALADALMYGSLLATNLRIAGAKEESAEITAILLKVAR